MYSIYSSLSLGVTLSFFLTIPFPWLQGLHKQTHNVRGGGVRNILQYILMASEKCSLNTTQH